MKIGLQLTSVLVVMCLAATWCAAQDSSHPVSMSSGVVAKCTGSSTCKACKNCSACEHCKKEGGQCSVCKTAANSGGAEDIRVSSNGDVTEVPWSSKSLKPAATTLAHLRVRSGPGVSYKIVGNVTSKDPLIIIGEKDGWYKIVASHVDLVGFVETEHVQLVK